MQRSITTLLLLAAFFGALSAQTTDQPTLKITDDTGLPGQTVCVPVSLHDLDGLTTIQGGIAWDTNALRFVGVELGNLPNFTSSDLNLETSDEGSLLYAWSSLTGLGVALPDSALFLELCFVIRSGTPPGAYYVAFNDEILPEVSIDLVAVATDYRSGWVTVPDAGGATLELDFLLSGDCGYTQTDLAPTLAGGTPPYTFTWTGPFDFTSSADTLFDLTVTGEYTVTVTDQAAGTWTGTALYTDVNLSQDLTPIADAFLTPPACTEPTGEISLELNGPVSDYGIDWSTGATTASISGLAGGVYSVTVTRLSDGCTQERFFELFPDEADVVLLAGVNLELPDCTTQSGGSITLIPAFPGLTFAWSNGATASTLTDLATGDYTVRVTNTAGCTEVRTFELDPPENFDLELAQIDAACGTPSGELTAIASDGPAGETYTYAWDNGATTATITDLAAGTYGVTVSSATGCIRTATAVIEQQTELLLEATVQPIGCDTTGGVVLTVAPGAEIAWSDGSAAAAYSVTSAGEYALTLSHPSGCEQDYSFTVPDYRPPFAPAATTVEPSECTAPSGSISLDFTDVPFAYTYLWADGPSGTANSIQRSALAPGVYTLYLSNPFGCSDTLEYTVETAGSFTVTADVTPVICATPGSITLGGAGADNFSFSWATGATTATISAPTAGDYQATVTTAIGCEQVVTTTVPAESEPAVWSTVAVTDPDCGAENGSIEIALEAGTTATWSTGAAGSSVAELAAGDYELYLATPNGCLDTVFFTLTAGTELLVEPTSVEITDADCDGQGGAIAVAFPGGEELSYAWSTGAMTAEISDLAAGTYGLTVTGNAGCTAEFSYTVEEDAGFAVAIETDPISCTGEGSLVATPDVAGDYVYVWNTGETTAAITVTTSGTYSVTVADPATGCERSASVAVAEPSLPVLADIDFACAQTNTCALSVPTTLTLAGGTGAFTLTWSDGVETTTETETATRSLDLNTSYAVTITDASGCEIVAEEIQADCPAPAPLRIATYVECETDDSSPQPTVETYLVAEVLGAASIHTFDWSDGLADTSYYRSRRAYDPAATELSVTVTDAAGVTVTESIAVADLAPCASAETALVFAAPHVTVVPGTSFRYPVRVSNYAGKSGAQTLTWNSCRFRVDSVFQYQYPATGPERIDLSAAFVPGVSAWTVDYADLGGNPSQDSLLVLELYLTAEPNAEGVSPILFTNTAAVAATRPEHGSITVSETDGLVNPGDANRDAAVNQLDLLYLGLAFDATGPDRRRRLLNDTEFAPPWSLQTPASALNLQHADPDGNGRVAASDTLALVSNWTSGDLGPGSVDTTGGVPLYVLADTLAPDTEFRIPVYLGTPADPATNVYGLATTLSWSGAGLIENSVRLDFAGSWLTDALTYARPSTAEQRIDFALVGRDGQDRSGSGPIAWISGRTTATSGTTITFQLGDSRLMNAAEGFFAIAPRTTEMTVDNPVATLDPELASQLVLYPVPATDRLYLRTPTQLQVEQVTVLGIDGRSLRMQAGNQPLDIADLPAGVYLLRVRTDRGAVTLRWTK